MVWSSFIVKSKCRYEPVAHLHKMQPDLHNPIWNYINYQDTIYLQFAAALDGLVFLSDAIASIVAYLKWISVVNKFDIGSLENNKRGYRH